MTHERTLLVEGNDDKKFFTTLLKKEFSFVEGRDFSIEPPKDTGNAYRNGINALLKILPSRLDFIRGGKIKNLGIIIDADSGEFGFEIRRAQITTILENYGYSISPIPTSSHKGEYFTHPDGYGLIGLWIMPNHASNGMFEDCLLEAIHSSPQLALLTTAKNTIQNLGEQRLFIEKHLSKAQLATWLAWQEDVGMSVGYAYHKELFDKNHPNIANLITWLTRVFQ